MKICSYKIERVPDNEFEINIPQETLYCFETGIRRALKIEPVFTAWNVKNSGEPEYVYNLKVTEIHQSGALKIECTTFNVSVDFVERAWNSKDTSPLKKLLEMLHNEWYNIRTKEQFENDFKIAFDSINSF